MKKFYAFVLGTCILLLSSQKVQAQTINYKVQSGDSMWKIAVKNEVGVSEIIQLNPQIKDPSLITPGEILKIPNIADIKNLENQVIKLVNQQRANKGLSPLTANWQLSRVARYKSQDMRDKVYFSHYSPTYGSPFDMMKNFGLSFYAAGENIAMGQSTPVQVMTSWMNSSGHRANILNPNYNEIGVGLAKGGTGGYYWTQEFIKR